MRVAQTWHDSAPDFVHALLHPCLQAFFFTLRAEAGIRVCFMTQGLQPSEKETSELRDHVIIAGFGRVGQIIAQLLSERLIPFVALDVSAERVQVTHFLLGRTPALTFN